MRFDRHQQDSTRFEIGCELILVPNLSVNENLQKKKKNAILWLLPNQKLGFSST